jgi:hypothetical protein
MWPVKREKYKEYLKNEKGDFIIQGFTLSFLAERDLVKIAIVPHKAILVRNCLEFEDWVELFTKKMATAIS